VKEAIAGGERCLVGYMYVKEERTKIILALRYDNNHTFVRFLSDDGVGKGRWMGQILKYLQGTR
jgi:hypothetical protein